MIKNSLLVILLLGVIIGCKKDKLEGQTSIFEGKWKWVSSLERKWNYTTDTYDYTTFPSSNYPDEYFLEFDRKGKVKYFRNDKKEEEYRIVFDKFNEGCTALVSKCYSFRILLNNNKKNGLAGSVNQDTIRCSDTNLPLEYQSEILYYSHFYVRAN